MLTYKIKEIDLNKRADLLLKENYPQLSRSHIKKLAADGRLFFDARTIAANSRLKKTGDLKLDYVFPSTADLPEIKLDILFEDEDLLVIDKPEGVIVHARSRYEEEASVASFLRDHCRWPALQYPAAWADLRQGIVHRLDRGVSGVLLCAKTPEIQADLQRQFREQSVVKTYLGLVEAKAGLPPQALIDKPIARSLDGRKFKTSRLGKKAQTFFKIKKRFGKYYLLEIQPRTGRTHQIRVHLSSLGIPLAGDHLYRGVEAPRLMLHAQKIVFQHPRTGREMSFSVRQPASFNKFVKDHE